MGFVGGTIGFGRKDGNTEHPLNGSKSHKFRQIALYHIDGALLNLHDVYAQEAEVQVPAGSYVLCATMTDGVDQVAKIVCLE